MAINGRSFDTCLRRDGAGKFVAAMIVAFAAAVSGCGRDDSQEQAPAASSNTASPSAAGGATPTTPADGPLQTGEVGSAGAQVPDGTQTGGRTTSPPK